MTLPPNVLNRVMQAASSLEAQDHREAAIIGGIVGCFHMRGRFDIKFIQHFTSASLAWARHMEMQHLREYEAQIDPTLTATNIANHGITTGLFGIGNIPDTSMPSKDEVTAVVQRFKAAYEGEPPTEVAA